MLDTRMIVPLLTFELSPNILVQPTTQEPLGISSCNFIGICISRDDLSHIKMIVPLSQFLSYAPLIIFSILVHSITQ